VAEWPLVCVMIVTYRRTALAVRTVEGVKRFLGYPEESLIWHIADDGSPPEHVAAIQEAIGGTASVSNASRQGVGASMNLGMASAWNRNAEHILWLEDDWELREPFDLRVCVKALEERPDVGQIRLAYISPGIWGELIAAAGRLWWKLSKGPTYTHVGHASLRSKAFCIAYGPYAEGLAPGETELWMCTRVNNHDGPTVMLPAWTGEWGPFAHIGGESLNAVRPGT